MSKVTRECAAFTLLELSSQKQKQQRITQCFTTAENNNNNNNNNNERSFENDISVSSQQRRNLFSRISVSTIILGQSWFQSDNKQALALNIPDFPSFPEFPSMQSDANSKKGYSKRIGGLAAKIRAISRTMVRSHVVMFRKCIFDSHFLDDRVAPFLISFGRSFLSFSYCCC